MSFRILNADEDRDVWDAHFDNLPPAHRDVHFTSAYARVQEALGTKSYCAVTDGWDGHIMQPFTLLLDRAGEACDIKSLYGFGGPIASASEMTGELADDHQENMCDYARSHKLVSEYCCLHPLYADKQCKLTGNLVLHWTKQAVVIDLPGFGLEKVARRTRRDVKKALSFEWYIKEVGSAPVNYLGFKSLYYLSMTLKNAASRWRFPLRYFEAHDETVGARWFYIEGHRALLTIGLGENAYAHLLGSDREHAHEGLDALLYYEAAVALSKSGFKRFHLGGGLTNSSRDSLLLFKGGFSDQRCVVGSYERVFDWTSYAQLTAAKEAEEIARHGRCSTLSWFPAYRREFV